MIPLKILFHYPGIFHKVLDNGEKKRPVMMYRAFLELGHDVTLFIGELTQRENQWDDLSKILDQFDFIYCENSHVPLRLTSESHLPKLFSVDYQLYEKAHEIGVPIGVFYRDCYWQYKEYRKEIGRLKYYFARYFYKQELQLYNQYASLVYMPSLGFKKLITQYISPKKSMSLPPGSTLQKLPVESKKIQLLYVGNIRPPRYDISEIVEVFDQLDNDLLSLNICTSDNNQSLIGTYYKLPNQVKVHHASGDELLKLYETADFIFLKSSNHDYAKIELPLKFFESIGMTKPIICKEGGDTADFVKEYGIGYTYNSKSELTPLLNSLEKKIDYGRFIENLTTIQSSHTWGARAQAVIDSLYLKKAVVEY